MAPHAIKITTCTWSQAANLYHKLYKRRIQPSNITTLTFNKIICAIGYQEVAALIHPIHPSLSRTQHSNRVDVDLDRNRRESEEYVACRRELS